MASEEATDSTSGDEQGAQLASSGQLSQMEKSVQRQLGIFRQEILVDMQQLKHEMRKEMREEVASQLAAGLQSNLAEKQLTEMRKEKKLLTQRIKQMEAAISTSASSSRSSSPVVKARSRPQAEVKLTPQSRVAKRQSTASRRLPVIHLDESSDDDEDFSAESSPPPKKRGPGRPRKPVALAAAKKRGPGRPRKNPVAPASPSPAESAQPVKRKRGRPRKVPLPSADASPPRKRRATATATDDSSMDSDSEPAVDEEMWEAPSATPAKSIADICTQLMQKSLTPPDRMVLLVALGPVSNGDKAGKVAAGKAGIAAPLVNCLKPSRSLENRTLAADLVGQLVRDVPSNQRLFGRQPFALARLLDLLNPTHASAARLQAVTAIAAVVDSCPENAKLLVAERGAVARLVQMLKPNLPDAARGIASLALGKIAEVPELRKTIAGHRGCIMGLSGVAVGSSQGSPEVAAQAIHSLLELAKEEDVRQELQINAEVVAGLKDVVDRLSGADELLEMLGVEEED